MSQDKQDPETPAEAPGVQKSLKNGAILLVVLAVLLGGIALLGDASKTEKKKDNHPVRPVAYYNLVFHTHQMGDAVYQATGDGKNCPPKGCRPNSQPLRDWMSESVVLAGKLAQSKEISSQCQDVAKETQQKLAALQAGLNKTSPYQTGYQAWQDINALLLTCD